MENKINISELKWIFDKENSTNRQLAIVTHEPKLRAICFIPINSDNAEEVAKAISNLPSLLKENEELKARCETYKKDYDSMVAEVVKLSGEKSELLEALSNLIKVSEESTKDIVAFENADILDNCIDKAKAVITK